MSSAEILSTLSFSTNVPTVTENEIVRDNIISTIKQLSFNLNLIFISGNNEVGKSTFLAQFARFEYKSTISVFLKPVNQFTSSIDNAIYDLCRQLHWLLYNNIEFNFTNGSEELLKIYFQRLVRKWKPSDNLYILLDGFEHLDSKYVNQLDLMLDILPIGFSNVKLIVSDNNGKLEKLSKNIISKLKYSSYPFSNFSLDDVERFFKKRETNNESLKFVLKLTNGIPSRIKYIYDLSANTSLDEILTDANNYNDLLERQWDLVDIENENLINCLSIISNENLVYPISKLSEILEIDDTVLSNFLCSLPFIEINENQG